MPEKSTSSAAAAPALAPGVGASAVAAVLVAALSVSTGYGMMLLLPLRVQQLGGSEADFGQILAAAVVPAVGCLVWLSGHPERFRPHSVLVVAVSGFGLVAAGAAWSAGGLASLVPVGLVVGTAWAVVYTVMPMVVDGMVTEAGRVRFFGYLTGTQQLGIGLGPVLAGWLTRSGPGYRGMFLAVAAVCVVAALATCVAASRTPDPRGRRQGDARPEVTVGRAGRAVLASRAGPWLLVIVLFACLFTTMTQFQTTFARAQGLDYSVFYVAYTVAVIAARFLVAPWVGRFDPAVVAAVAITVTAAAVASFLAVGSSAIAYASAAAVLGLGYGLALPTAQAQAVSVAAAASRPQVLPVAGLAFQAAILAFPLAVGWLVVRGGYSLLLVVLIGLGVVQAIIVWRAALRSRAPGGIDP